MISLIYNYIIQCLQVQLWPLLLQFHLFISWHLITLLKPTHSTPLATFKQLYDLLGHGSILNLFTHISAYWKHEDH
jgi:ABC-type nitrate/sulfonate/bicarbonate transport system permease component